MKVSTNDYLMQYHQTEQKFDCINDMSRELWTSQKFVSTCQNSIQVNQKSDCLEQDSGNFNFVHSICAYIRVSYEFYKFLFIQAISYKRTMSLVCIKKGLQGKR